MYYVTNFNSVNDVFGRHKQTFSSANNLADDYISSEHQDTESTYPLTNIGFFSDSKYVLIEVSMPGFKKEDVQVRYNGSVICIDAEYTDTNVCKCSDCSCCDELTYIQKNIPTKDINRKIYLNNAYIGAKIRSVLKNGILKILVVPMADYEDINIGGDEYNRQCCQSQQAHNQAQQTQQTQSPQPQMPYPFMPVPMPVPVMPYPYPMGCVPGNNNSCCCGNNSGNNGGNGGNSGSSCDCPEFIRVDEGDINSLFDDLTSDNGNTPDTSSTSDGATSDSSASSSSSSSGSSSNASSSDGSDGSNDSDNSSNDSVANNDTTDTTGRLSNDDILGMMGM